MKTKEDKEEKYDILASIPEEIRTKHAKLIKAISECHGNVSAACRMLNISRGALHPLLNTKWIRDYIKYCREQIIDEAEDVLKNLLEDENVDSKLKLEVAKTILQTVGKQRYQDQPQVQITQNVMSDADKTIAIKNIFGITDKNDESK